MNMCHLLPYGVINDNNNNVVLSMKSKLQIQLPYKQDCSKSMDPHHKISQPIDLYPTGATEPKCKLMFAKS